jgi:hypothetical protein
MTPRTNLRALWVMLIAAELLIEHPAHGAAQRQPAGSKFHFLPGHWDNQG